MSRAPTACACRASRATGDLRTGRVHDRADTYGGDAGADGLDQRVREVAIRRVLDPRHRPIWPVTRGRDEPGIGHAGEVGRHQHDALAPDEARCGGQTCAGAADDGDTVEWCSEQGRAGPPQVVEDAALLFVGEVEVAVLRRLGQVPHHDLDGVGGDQTQRGLVEIDRLGKRGVVVAGEQGIHVITPMSSSHVRRGR